MKKDILSVAIIFLGICMYSQTVIAADCSGKWSILPNRNPGMSPCIQLGLNSHRGVCQPGMAYETLCDSMKGGRYRVCQGPRLCGNGIAPPQSSNQAVPPCVNWDYKRNRPCPSGYTNPDCRGACE